MNQSQSRAMRPCDDILGLIGEAVKNKREEATRAYWVGLRRQNSFLPPSFPCGGDQRLGEMGHNCPNAPFCRCELVDLLRIGLRTGAGWIAPDHDERLDDNLCIKPSDWKEFDADWREFELADLLQHY